MLQEKCFPGRVWQDRSRHWLLCQVLVTMLACSLRGQASPSPAWGLVLKAGIIMGRGLWGGLCTVTPCPTRLCSLALGPVKIWMPWIWVRCLLQSPAAHRQHWPPPGGRRRRREGWLLQLLQLAVRVPEGLSPQSPSKPRRGLGGLREQGQELGADPRPRRMPSPVAGLGLAGLGTVAMLGDSSDLHQPTRSSKPQVLGRQHAAWSLQGLRRGHCLPAFQPLRQLQSQAWESSAVLMAVVVYLGIELRLSR